MQLLPLPPIEAGSRLTDQQIALALRQAEQGTQVAEVTRKMDISRMFEDGLGYCILPWNLVKILEQAGIAQW